VIKARFIIESQGKPRSFVDSTLKKHIENMKGVEGIKVLDTKFEPTEEKDGLFSALADVGVETKTLEDFFGALIGLAPTAVVVEGPAKVEAGLGEIQNISNDIVQLFHAFASANAEMRMILEQKK
jgi:hypothetical protein